MLSLAPPVRVFLATQSTDMRRSFDGLCLLVQSQLQQDPFSGHRFVFLNRRRCSLLKVALGPDLTVGGFAKEGLGPYNLHHDPQARIVSRSP